MTFRSIALCLGLTFIGAWHATTAQAGPPAALLHQYDKAVGFCQTELADKKANDAACAAREKLYARIKQTGWCSTGPPEYEWVQCGKPTGAAPISSEIPAPQASLTCAETDNRPHVWSMRRDCTYGYEASLTASDRVRGLAAGDIVMVDYWGLIGGSHHWVMRESSSSATWLDCSGACDFVRIRRTFDTEVTADRTIRAAPHSLMASMVSDLRTGGVAVASLPGCGGPALINDYALQTLCINPMLSRALGFNTEARHGPSTYTPVPEKVNPSPGWRTWRPLSRTAFDLHSGQVSAPATLSAELTAASGGQLIAICFPDQQVAFVFRSHPPSRISKPVSPVRPPSPHSVPGRLRCFAPATGASQWIATLDARLARFAGLGPRPARVRPGLRRTDDRVLPAVA